MKIVTRDKKKEVKFLGGRITEVKQEDRNGVAVGIIEGYIATWDVDEGDYFGVKDQFKKGAFMESILEHIQRKRQVRLKDHHGRTVGGFPIEFVREDDRGLFGIGEVNLEVQQGMEVYKLAKQGVLVDFSIGFSAVEAERDDDIRTITKAIIWEGSVVDEPMNRAAQITQVKDSEGNDVDYFNTEAIKDWTERDVEQALREGAKFSKNASKAVLSIATKAIEAAEAEQAETLQAEEEQKAMQDALSEINSFTESMQA